jgi:hypothetical protein
MCMTLARRVLVVGFIALFLGAASPAIADLPKSERPGAWPGLPCKNKKLPRIYTSAPEDPLYAFLRFRPSRETRLALRYATVFRLGDSSMILQVKARPKPRSVVKLELLF